MNARVHIPLLPNFLTVTIGKTEVKVGIEDLSDADLAQLIHSWGLALLEHAKNRRLHKGKP